LYVPIKQLEADNAVEITYMVEYVERTEDPLIQAVRMHEHRIDSALLQTARRLKAEVQTETREVMNSVA
jgi:hypothetical protein